VGYSGGARRALHILTRAMASPDRSVAKRAFEAMMPMQKIDIATIEAAIAGR
jgi:predicted 3-demethylubiquinone-9 3-methyltransferase (glyoxalase superfamily)